MNGSRIKWLPIFVFVVLAIALGVAWAIHARDSGMLGNTQSAGIVAASVAQLSVLIAALITMAVFSRESFRMIGWRPGPWRVYLFVFFAVVTMLALFTFVTLAGGFLHRAAGPPVQVIRLLLNFLILMIILCLFAFAEEFGWRGFLLPKLLPLGERPALLLSGLIWFCWEAPLVYFGLLDSTIVKEHPVIALVCHFLQICLVAIALGYLRLRYQSIFLPAFAHGLLNSLGGLSFILLTQSDPLWGDFGGPIGTVFLFLVVAALWVRLGGKTDTPSQVLE
ncbi:MAG: CPBP family intramembrane metalloprotease [Chthoniobacterales bacterium]|nr:CPBP family intramembrane metalloprotease [Chthoniobacterales bacterium]